MLQYKNISRAESVMTDLNKALSAITELNRHLDYTSSKNRQLKQRDGKLKKVLIANRGEIAKRFFIALHEESIRSVAVVTSPDEGQSWYEFAD